MAKSESESSSSSSSSDSDSDSSSSDEEEVDNRNAKATIATSVEKKIPTKKRNERVDSDKTSKEKKRNSSSESSSSSSDDDEGASSSSPSSSCGESESDVEAQEVSKVKSRKEIPQATALEEKPVQQVAELKVDGDEPSQLQMVSNSEGKVALPESAAQELVGKDVEREMHTEQIEKDPEMEPELEPERDEAPQDCHEIAPQSAEECQETVTTKPESEKEVSPEVLAPVQVDEPGEPQQTEELIPLKINEGEPEPKRSKVEEEPKPIKTLTPFNEKSKSSRAKDSHRRRSSKDRSRSPGRHDRRRSGDRDERSRRNRSRSRIRDRRRRRSRTRSRSNNRPKDNSPSRRKGRSPQSRPDESKEPVNPNEKITERQRRTVDLLTSRTGGAYIPPAKLRMMQAEITDKASAAYQRIAWEALKKSIHGYINKVNVDNIGIITRELLKENIVRGRGLLCRSIIQAQAASPTFTHVYAALVAIINSKFPNIGELLLKRLVIQFKRAFRRNDKAICLSASRFVAHLVNQRVAHEILALEILTLLVETPTDDSVEVAIAFLKECGMKLTEVSSKGIGAIFEMLKNILHEGKLDKRVQYMIEVVFQVRKDGFKDHQSVIEALELVEEDDQFTHLLMLDEATTTEDNLNAFKFDDKYETNEDKYKGLSKEILGSDASDSDGDGSEGGSDSSDSEEDEEEKAKAEAIIDNTETNLVALRRTIYLTINSSLDYEECAHKLMKMQLKPGQEIELCHMFLDCCAEQRTYEKFYGLLAQRFCSINKTYIEPFEEIFKDTYQTTHRLDTNRLRNVSKFFAHLLFTDAIGWDVIECIKLNEDDTTSSSRIFIKILFQELAEYMGLGKLNGKLKDDVLTESLAGLFPKDNPRNTRFSINFFTSIGLGGLTDDLRQFLKNAPKNVPAINSELLPEKITISSSSSSSSSSPSSSSSSESSSESSSSSEEEKRKRKKKKSVVSKKGVNKKTVVKSKKQNSKAESKKKSKSKKKQQSSSSDSSEESSSDTSSSSSENSSNSSDSTSEDDKKKKKKISNKKIENKKKKMRSDKLKDVNAKKDIRVKEQPRKRDEFNERMPNGRSENGRGRDNSKPYREDQYQRDRNDRKRMDKSPDRNHHYRDNYSQKAARDHRVTGKSRNGSKERG